MRQQGRGSAGALRGPLPIGAPANTRNNAQVVGNMKDVLPVGRIFLDFWRFRLRCIADRLRFYRSSISKWGDQLSKDVQPLTVDLRAFVAEAEPRLICVCDPARVGDAAGRNGAAASQAPSIGLLPKFLRPFSPHTFIHWCLVHYWVH